MIKEYYAIIDINETQKDGSKKVKSYVYSYHDYKHIAIRELNKLAKKINGKLTYFGAFKN